MTTEPVLVRPAMSVRREIGRHLGDLLAHPATGSVLA